MPGVEELLAKWREENLQLQQRIRAVQEIGEGKPQCGNITTSELCEEISSWADEITVWLYELWDDLYGGEPGTVDPPPKPPFKG